MFQFVYLKGLLIKKYSTPKKFLISANIQFKFPTYNKFMIYVYI